MNLSSADLSTILDRILDTAADNLRVAKILIQLVSTPTTSRPTHYSTAAGDCAGHITLANLFAPVGAIFFVATLLMQTMVPLRVATMIAVRSSSALVRSPVASRLFLVSAVAPINAIVFVRCSTWSRKRAADAGDTSRNGSAVHDERNIAKGDIVCKKDDPADEMFLTVTGNFL